MSIIKIEDIAHVRFSAPSLDDMSAFLTEFGLTPVRHTDGALYARGTGPQPFLHSTVEGDPGFQGIGLRAHNVTDLEKLALAEGMQVEALDAPGGGSVLRLIDPDGYLVEVVAGQQQCAPLPAPADAAHNNAHDKQRLQTSIRLQAGPASAIRLGHAVLEVKDFRVSEDWYKSRFGFITSDEIEAAPNFAIGAFLRCDLGNTPTDHHTLFLLQGPGGPRFNHAAFEVANFDDLMCGHTHLTRAKRTPAWGVGRHVLGSQIFDYWKDPWGHELEHWTDGDLFTASDRSSKATLADLLEVQWGPNHPMSPGASE